MCPLVPRSGVGPGRLGPGESGLGGAGGWGSRENSSYKISRLSIQASSSRAIEGDQGQIVVWGDRERPGKLIRWFRNGRAGHRGGQGVDGECPDEEECESNFGEHDDMECREGKQITTAPGLKFVRWERRTGVSHTAAERFWECASDLL